MEIREGKFYRTRDGQKIGPMKSYHSGDGFPWWFPWSVETISGMWWADDGAGQPRSIVPSPDLVAEWTDEPASPVRTVTTTRKIIEPGTYGRLYIDRQRSNGKTALIFVDRMPDGYALLTSAELRAAASIFTQIADALDEQP